MLSLWRDLLTLITSQQCYSCDRDLTIQEKGICFHCLSQIERTGFEKNVLENELYYRLAGRVPLSGAFSLYYFDKKGTLQKLIQLLKYQDTPQIGKYLGRQIGLVLKDSNFMEEADCLVPVPLHPSKKIKRGYNQAELIAKGISEITEIPVDTRLLKRKQKTLTQARTGADGRWENVAEAFQSIKEPPQKVILVDDVITTGATLEACMRALQAAASPPAAMGIVSVGMARRA